MARFKVRLRVTGFELEVEGNREDVPLIAQSVGQQFAGMLQPASDIVEGEIISESPSNATMLPAETGKTTTKRRSPSKRRSAPTGTSAKADEEQAVDWVHDPAKWGTPQQSWNTATKSLWLLYVVGKETGMTQLSSNQISVTFNKHFRQAKMIKNFNVTRDLGKLKTNTETQIYEDTTKTPNTWFLTQEGEKQAQQLVLQALGQASATKSTTEG